MWNIFKYTFYVSAPERLTGKLSKIPSFPQMGHKHVIKRDSSKSYQNMRTLLQSSSNQPSMLDSVKDLPERRSVALIGTVCIDNSSNCKFLNLSVHFKLQSQICAVKRSSFVVFLWNFTSFEEHPTG